jgi:hypothetical protein
LSGGVSSSSIVVIEREVEGFFDDQRERRVDARAKDVHGS